MRAKWSMLFGPEGSIILWPKGAILFGQRGQICLAFPTSTVPVTNISILFLTNIVELYFLYLTYDLKPIFLRTGTFFHTYWPTSSFITIPLKALLLRLIRTK